MAGSKKPSSRKVADEKTETLRKEVFALRRELNKQIKEVREYSRQETTAPRQALKQVTELNKMLRQKSITARDYRGLTTIRRKIQHIMQMKTSTLKGAKETSEHLKKLIPNLNKLNRSTIDKMFEVYDKLTEMHGSMVNFKYELYQEVTKLYLDETTGRSRELDPDVLTGAIMELYETYVEHKDELIDMEQLVKESKISGRYSTLLQSADLLGIFEKLT